MTQSAQAVLDQALRLDAVERAELIDRLFHSFDRTVDPAVDAAWAVEAESRLDAYEAGKLTADSADAVFARLARR
jgi:putative addiction module component (TIGR02574 family)